MAIAAFYLPLLLVLAGVGALALFGGIPASRLMRDAAAVAELWPYTGAVSQLGLQLWGAGAFAALGTAVLLRTVPGGPAVNPVHDRQAASFLLGAGLLTGLLLADDALMLHEYSGRVTGLDNTVVIAGYALLAAALFWRHGAFVRRNGLAGPLPAGILLALSLATDKLNDYGMLAAFGVGSADVRFLLEDGFKLVGIGAWTLYLSGLCYAALAARMAEAHAARPVPAAAPQTVRLADTDGRTGHPDVGDLSDRVARRSAQLRP